MQAAIGQDPTLRDRMYIPYRYRAIVGLGMLLVVGLVAPHPSTSPSRPQVIPDLSISTSMTPAETWAENEPFEIRVSATNQDASAKTSATIMATVPFDAQLEPVWSPNGSACDIRPERGNTRSISCPTQIKAGETATVTIKGKAPEGAGTYTLASEVKIGGWRQSHPTDPDPSNNTTSTALAVI